MKADPLLQGIGEEDVEVYASALGATVACIDGERFHGCDVNGMRMTPFHCVTSFIKNVSLIFRSWLF